MDATKLKEADFSVHYKKGRPIPSLALFYVTSMRKVYFYISFLPHTTFLSAFQLIWMPLARQYPLFNPIHLIDLGSCAKRVR